MHSKGFPRRMEASSSSRGASADFAVFSASAFASPGTAAAAAEEERLTDAAAAAAAGNRIFPLGAQNPPSLTSPFATFSSSSSSPTTIAGLRRTFARRSSEYLSRSGHAFVRPLKLGRRILIRGPHSAGAAGGSASAHTSAPDSSVKLRVSLMGRGRRSPFPSRRHPPRAKDVTRATSDGGLVSFHQPWVSAPSRASSKAAKAEGRPHVLTPCARASLLLTKTRAAQAHDVGGFQTRPPRATISSKTPAGLSSYRARYTPPRVYPKSSTSFRSAGTCLRASLALTRLSWYSARPRKLQGASSSLYPPPILRV